MNKKMRKREWNVLAIVESAGKKKKKKRISKK